jgi:Rrf2 family iron-sulfur cluster assembly transcriptional regulator
VKLSTRSRYGTRLLLDLAIHHDQWPVQIGDIAKRQNVSVQYLEQIIRPLKKAELVSSVRGPKGGHVLAKSPEEITLGQIVRLLENGTQLVECVGRPEACEMSGECRCRLAWKKAADAMYTTLDSLTVADLMSKSAL